MTPYTQQKSRDKYSFLLTKSRLNINDIFLPSTKIEIAHQPNQKFGLARTKIRFCLGQKTFYQAKLPLTESKSLKQNPFSLNQNQLSLNKIRFLPSVFTEQK